MTPGHPTLPAPPPWADAVTAAGLFAVDPLGTAGIVLRAMAGPVRARWLEGLYRLLPPAMPVRRLPLHVADGRLLGGLDLAATLQSGRPVAERGLLAEADGGVVLAAMAERIGSSAAARLTAALDTGQVVLERDGLALRSPARFGVVALDEGLADDEQPPSGLIDRLGFRLDLTAVALRDALEPGPEPEEVSAARSLLAEVRVPDDIVEALCGAGLALGIASLRAPMLAVRVARAAAALDGRTIVTQDDAALAARLVLACRATQLPVAEPPPAEDESPEPPDETDRDDGDDDDTPDLDQPLEDMILAAAQAAMPLGLLARLRAPGGGRSRARSAGKAGALQASTLRGRPIGVRRGEPRAGARLNVVETLRAAAPWQGLRRQEWTAQGQPVRRRIEVRKDDFRVTRFKRRSETTTIFVVDASGSAALHRLAEAKGAVELLLADCYIRRDQVALIAFRGRGADLLLPPTRSLVRAKRSLAGLPGGGGTPLAAGVDAATLLAEDVRRRGQTPALVFLTDARANIARDGAGGRPRAEEEALSAARRLAELGVSVLMVDTSPHGQPFAQRLAEAMRAHYLPLPRADAASVSAAVRVVSAA